MTDLKFDKNCFKKKADLEVVNSNPKKNFVRKIRERNAQIYCKEEDCSNGNIWNIYLLLFVFSLLVLVLINSVFDLQVLEGDRMYTRSTGNQIHLINIPARRGIIFDRNGKKLVENHSVVDCFLNIPPYLSPEGVIDVELLEYDISVLERILGESLLKNIEGEEFTTVTERIYIMLENQPDIERVKIASNLDNEAVITIKSLSEEMPSVSLEEGISRYYSHKDYLSHILGYTSIVNAEDFEKLDYVGFNDIVGRSGLERYYDEILFGEKGQIAVEVDVLGRPVSENELIAKEPVPGKSLYLSIDLEAQKESHNILSQGIDEYGASSGTMIVQDVNNGEIIVMSSYPSYDNNLFVGGISQDDFDSLLYADGSPLTNKAIAAQVPPGSIFKTIVASAALDAGVIEKDTVYVSRRGYTFSGGAPFQEFRNNAYGPLNLIQALMLSSNIYFCEVIRSWDIEELIPYLENFGIGQYTGIDIPGEGTGRIPSPENKVRLARSSSPWLEPYWLPEGDSCNAVIGQGIVTVTPIQAVNWTSAIANNGVLHTPHIGVRVVDAGGKEELLEFKEKNKDFVSKDALKYVRLGMRESVSGDRRVIIPLAEAKVDVAAKTGTAEFGRLSEDGEYEHTHAWVTGFFPYEDPEYAFVVFLEDGGESNNASQLAREFIDWFVD